MSDGSCCSRSSPDGAGVVCVTNSLWPGPPGSPYKLTHFFRKLSSANATSSATAQAARLAALAHAAYLSLSPEAVRGLLVHEARWTPAMMGNGLYTKSGRPRLAKKELMKQVIRRYGWGVPSAERVLSSAPNAVTLIVQSQLIPFQRNSSGGVSLAELEFHELPWPLEQLRELGAATVALRVTLSYFVEPNPGRLGMRGRYSYASHRLRFAIRAPGESADGFERRITAQAEAESDTPSHAKAFEGDKNWLVGPQGRNQGSEAFRFPNVIVWFGVGGHELRSVAGGMAWFVRSSRSWRWLVPSVLGLLEAREKKVREEVARLREEAERVQTALGEAERTLQRLADARVTVAEVLAEPPRAVVEPVGSAVAGAVVPRRTEEMTASALPADYQRIISVLESEAGREGMRCQQLAAALGLEVVPAKVEGLRSKAKRLVDRGWALQTRPGVFTPLGTPAG
jgi:hypothetical protein